MNLSIYWGRFINKVINEFRDSNGILKKYGAEFMFKNRTWRVFLVFQQMPQTEQEAELAREEAYEK